MFESKHRKADIAFVMGLITAPWWCGAQAMKALTTLEGVSLAQYVTFVLSFAVSAVLANEARKKSLADHTRSITQQIVMLVAWVVSGVLMVTLVLFNGDYVWSYVDTQIVTVSSVALIGVALWAFTTHKSVGDAAVRALIGVALKPIPQFLLIQKVWEEGSKGFAVSAIILGNISIWTRIYLNVDSLLKEGINRDKKWLLVAEILNGISWLAVSVVWLVR